MSLASLLGLRPRERRTHDPARAWTGPADATPIHSMLDRRGVPWRATRGELAERFGVAGGAIAIATPHPFLPGLVRPLATPGGPGLAPDLAATEFTGLVRLGDDPVADVRQTAGEVGLYLGRARVAETRGGAECLWRFGDASLALISTPDGCEIRIRTA